MEFIEYLLLAGAVRGWLWLAGGFEFPDAH